MKKKQVCLMFASLCAVSFCGCIFLEVHDCSHSPEKCIPICIKDQEKFEKNRAEEQSKWEAFKNTPPLEYTPTGIIMVDNINKILVNISNQIQYEVVIPYTELDKQGHVQAYRQFCADVDCRMRGARVNYYTAVQETYKYWETRYGAERCQQLMAAIPFIENLRANQQLRKAINRNSQNILRLIREKDKAIALLKDKKKAIEIGVAVALTTGPIILQLQESLAYLADLQKQKYQKERDIKTAIERIQKYNDSND